MRTRNNPIGGVGIQLAIAGATAVVTTTVAVLLTNWLTKKSTTENIASGKQPLPPGSTPTTTGPPGNVTPVSTPQPPPPPPPPQIAPQNLVNVANQIAQGVQSVLPKCPPGYHAVATGQPNFPYMCIAD